MRRPTARLFPHVATLRNLAPGSRPSAWSAGTALACCVQDARSDRVVRLGKLLEETTTLIRFPAPPADTSAGARVASAANLLGPAVAVQDRIEWVDAAGNPATFQALGRAVDEGGQGVYFTVQCKQIGA